MAKYLQRCSTGINFEPVLFNVFLIDIFNFVKENKLYNYADDNTLSQSGTDLNGSAKSLEKESAMLIDCFPNNKMKANPDIFHSHRNQISYPHFFIYSQWQ